MVNTIGFQFDFIKFRKDFSVCRKQISQKDHRIRKKNKEKVPIMFGKTTTMRRVTVH